MSNLLARRGLRASFCAGHTASAHLRVNFDDGDAVKLREPVLKLNFGHVDWNFEPDGVTRSIDDRLHEPDDDVREELLHSTR